MTQQGATHTPGPWECRPVFIAQHDEEAICFSEYKLIYDGLENLITYHETALANARLIAQSPALLAALKRVSTKLLAYKGFCAGDKELDTVLHLASAAILAAEGSDRP